MKRMASRRGYIELWVDTTLGYTYYSIFAKYSQRLNKFSWVI